MKLFMILVLTVFMGFSSIAQAKDTDLAKVACKDFLAMPQDKIGLMLMWIDGYLSGKSDDTVINEEWMKELGTHVATFCAKESNKTIMDAIDALPSDDE